MKMLIAGEWVDRDKKIEVHDPYDSIVIDTVPQGSVEDVELAINSAKEGYEICRRLPTHKRMEILEKTAQYVKDNFEDFAITIAREGSKTIREARKEVSRCINTLKVSAEEARRIFGETIPFDSFPGAENKVGYYYRFPIGIIACITPFNDPLNLVAHKLGPAIAGGNSVVLKPATVTPLSAIKLVEAFLSAGLPPNVINLVTGYGSEIGDALVSDSRVRMISFTGGVEAGEHISKIAGLKKIGMELGSNSPVIIWKDADIETAVESCVSGAFWAAGQNCIGVQRILIHEDIYDTFRDKFVIQTKKYKIGNKLDENCNMGPMIDEKEAMRIEKWVNRAIENKATLLSGGKRTGTLYEPTVLENVPSGIEVDCNEVFAPVVNLYKISSLEDAIKEANNVDYGLLTSIFTQNIDIAFKAIHQLDCGGIIINESTDYRLDSMPFGGIKKSGLGREGIKFALQEMTEPKVVCFNLDSPPLNH
ncbi:MAG: aldehyde dehydrogenase family protein [Candidatus Hodarchaeales archaeon]|jgi:glyceraldehyde-3-phosphate dehydrogenase (NADP+)